MRSPSKVIKAVNYVSLAAVLVLMLASLRLAATIVGCLNLAFIVGGYVQEETR